MKNAKNAGTLRAVLDTNVLISAFTKPDGALGEVWRLARERRYRLIISPAIVAETARILRRRFHWTEQAIQTRIRVVVNIAEIVNPLTLPNAVPDDPDDNHIVACAVEGRADLIVSGDRHLLSLTEYGGIPIVRPVDFLRTLGQ